MNAGKSDRLTQKPGLLSTTYERDMYVAREDGAGGEGGGSGQKVHRIEGQMAHLAPSS